MFSYFHREGRVYILGSFAILFLINLYVMMRWTYQFWDSWGVFVQIPLLILSLGLWAIFLQFFRNPSRPIANFNDKLLYAPADGKVVVIEEAEENEYYKDRRLMVSIFMSPFNVHVNRAPVGGVVDYFRYHAGKYLVAWHPKSSTENERTSLVISNKFGTVLLRQIAGALARRIICYADEGQTLSQGNEFGFIKFGSRVDLYLPLGTKIHCTMNQVVKGNQTIIAEFV